MAFDRFMKRLGVNGLAAALAASVALAGAAQAGNFITVASTTSTEQSGLF